jgi:ERCC4-type nuclease
MLLQIDCREAQIIERIQKHQGEIQYETASLDVGDFRFVLDGIVVLIIERKTVSDLSQSIKDGRYRDQKHRMLDVYGRNKIIYVIEGNVFTSHFVSDNVKGAIINTLIRDDIKVVSVNNLNETVEFICEIYKRLSKDPTKYTNTISNTADNNSVCQTSIPNVQPHARKDYITPDKFLMMVLCQIPGISSVIAKQLSNEYGDSLLSFMTTATVEDIANFKLNSGRKLGNKLATQIMSYTQKI